MSHTSDEDVRAALAALAGAWRVDNVTVWEVRGDAIVALRMRDGSSDEIEAVQRAWRARGAELRQGRTLRAGETELYPLRGGDQSLRGFVHVHRPGKLSAAQQAIAEVALEQLARVLDAPDPDAALFAKVTDAGKRARLIEERARLIGKLDRLRWVFTRVARAEGVTRQTVRNRVLRLHIEIPEWARHGKRRRSTT